MAIVCAALSERTFEVGATKWEVQSKVVFFLKCANIFGKKCVEKTIGDNLLSIFVNSRITVVVEICCSYLPCMLS